MTAGLSQQEVADALGNKTNIFVSELERGARPLTADLASSLESIYGVSKAEILAAAPRTELPAGDATSNDRSEAQSERLTSGTASRHPGSPTWFGGTDRFSSRRRAIHDDLIAQGLQDADAELMAVALEPFLASTPATYEFFDELQKLRDAVSRSLKATSAGTGDRPRPAVEAVASFRKLAETHGATSYALALDQLPLRPIRLTEAPGSLEASTGTPNNGSEGGISATAPPTESQDVLSGTGEMRDAGNHGSRPARPSVEYSSSPPSEAPRPQGSPPHPYGPPSQQDRLSLLIEAVRGRRCLHLRQEADSPRTLDPYVLAQGQAGFYAAGYDRKRGAVRCFNLDSLEVESDEPDGPPFGVPAAEQLDRAIAQLPQGSEIIAVVAEHPNAAPGTYAPARNHLRLPRARTEPDAIPPSISSGPSAEVSGASEPPGPDRIFGQLDESDPERLELGSNPQTEKQLPIVLSIDVGGYDLFLQRELLPHGDVGYVLADLETGGPARAGVRIRDSRELPLYINFQGVPLPLGEVHLWDRATSAFKSQAEPLSRRRGINRPVVIGERRFDLDARLSRRSTTEWVVTARLTPRVVPVPAQEPTGDSTQATRPMPALAPSPTAEEAVRLESIAGAPAISTPLFKLGGVWHSRWSIDKRGTSGMIPRELFELNRVPTEPLVTPAPIGGQEVRLEPSKYGTGFHLRPTEAVARAKGARPGDLLFVAIDARGEVYLRRVTHQKIGKAASHLKIAALLVGLDEDHPTLSSILWALGVEEHGDIDTAVRVAEQRSDGRLVRELKAYAMETAPPPDLETTFGQL